MHIKKLNPFEVYRGLPRSVYVLFFATIVNGMVIFVYPFLALFLTQKLNYSVAQAGLFMFIASLAYIPGTFIGGKLTDQVGRRMVLFVSQTIASNMFLDADSWGHRTSSRFLYSSTYFLMDSPIRLDRLSRRISPPRKTDKAPLP